jgi:hypothetical protein
VLLSKGDFGMAVSQIRAHLLQPRSDRGRLTSLVYLIEALIEDNQPREAAKAREEAAGLALGG